MKTILQFHGSTSISILKRLIEIIFMQKDNSSNKSQSRIVSNSRISKPFFDTRDRRLLHHNNTKNGYDKLNRNWTRTNWEKRETETFESGEEK
jgi:hypothetical protein